ncbi:MAG: hypothetical protein AB1297_02430, partial [bacterium]
MVKDICFYINTPLEKRDYKRFGVELLLSRGFNVMFLDITRVFHPDYLANYRPSDLSDYQNVSVAENKDDISDFLQSHKKHFGIDLIGAQKNNIFLYKLLKQLNIQYASFCGNSIPVVRNIDKFLRIIGYVKRNGFKGIYNKVINKLSALTIDFSDLQPPRYILAGGRKFISKRPAPSKNTRIIWAHTLDYDLYLNLKQNKKQNSTKSESYCVFLDEYFPFHPDFLLQGLSVPVIDPVYYYRLLNKFFDYIEKYFEVPVIIAAHPRSQYDAHPDYFRGRKIIKGNTIELVAQSKFVLAHSST